MMAVDWKAEIARVAYWKQIAAEHDKQKALPWRLPRVGASQEKITLAENTCGVIFSDQFREFLVHADGWEGFYVLNDLFGTSDFIGGRSQAVMERPELIHFLNSIDLKKEDVIPVGGSNLDIDVFLHVSPSSKVLPGGVIWFANEEVDRYGSFGDFFSAMVNYNAQVAHRLTNKV